MREVIARSNIQPILTEELSLKYSKHNSGNT